MYRTAGVSAVSLETSCSRQTFSNMVWGAVMGFGPLPGHLNGSLSNARGSRPLVARAGTGLRQLDPIDNFEVGPGARLDDIGADAGAAVRPLVVLDVHHGLALSVLSLRDAVHLELP